MSDSDSELLTTNRVFSFQNESTTVSARGPNINTSNLTGLSFRQNVLTSTMNMPRNYEWQRRAESNYDQRSVGYRRETSPMSIASACDARQRNFNSSYYGRGMSSHRSVYNGRSGSPMSMRSMDSNATMCASDIVMALKNTQFSKYDMRMIKEAYNKLIKHKVRKRVEKRRNLKLFLKGYRRKSGYDSGELGSNSSMSSDDNKSTRTLNYRNMSSCRSTKTDVADFRRTIKDNDMFTDCTDNFRHSRMHGRIGRPANMNTSRSSVSSVRSMIEKPITKSMNPINFNKTQSQSCTLQDRFKNGFLLPSQRFNKSVAASSIPEAVEKPIQRNKPNNKANREVHPSSPQEPSDDDDEIFPDVTTIERPPVNQRKRSIDDDDICFPVQKKPKVASPCKNMSHSFKNSTVVEKANNDFEFAKPAFPVRKSATQKAKEKMISNSDMMNAKEQLISKSRAPLSDSIIEPLQVKPNPQPKVVEEAEQDTMDKTEESAINQNTPDLSIRPSFIKRKLFTQKMDVTEKTNDVANSPQNSVYGAIQKEKNKARKLVTSQYCLSRDIQSDENNLLDLIHKIVPAERMNATNQTNKTANNKSEDNDDKWDVTSIISTRNNDEDVSDTFTDEDTILDGVKQSSPKVAQNQTKKSPAKNPEKIVKKSPLKVTQNNNKVLVEKNGTPKTTVQKCVKSFWDTDFESDVEGTPARRQEFKENKKIENTVLNATSKVKFQSFSSKFPANKTTVANNASIMNSTVDTTQKFNNSNKTFKLFTHRNNKPNVKRNMHESLKEDVKSVMEPQSKKQKVIKAKSCLDISKSNNLGQSVQENKPKTKPDTNKTPPKQRKPKVTPERTKEKEPVKKQNSKQDNKSKSNEKPKKQNKKTDTEQSKSDNTKEVLIDKKTRSSNKSTKNKTMDEKHQNKKSDKQINKIQNRKTKDEKAITQLNTTLNNNKKNPKGKVSKLSDSLIYEDSFTETINNKSMRPIRSCRNSKQNVTLDASKANNTINRSLRSRDITLTKDSGLTKKKVVEKNKNVAKDSKKATKNEQSVLSDLSFSLIQDKKTKKPISSYNSRIDKPQEIDTSDISFTLNDKDSPKKIQGNSAKPKINLSYMKQAIVNLTTKNVLLTKHLIEQRPTRNRTVNRRYVT